MGSGRTELVSAIFGALADQSHGEVYLAGQPVKIRSPQEAIRHGLALVTEDRKRIGLVLGQSVLQNMTISSLETIANRWGLSMLRKNGM